MSIRFSDVFNSSDLNINNPKVEDFLNKTRDVAETVSKKSAERLEISKKKLDAIDTKAKLAKQYEKFGELQYSAFIGEEIDNSQVESIAAEISSLKDKLDLLNIEIDEAKASFNESVSNMAQKTREVFQRDTSVDDAKIDVEVFESEEE